MRIKVKFNIKSWSGWPSTNDNPPTPKEKEFELSKGDVVGAKDLFDVPASVEVTDFFDSAIEITTNGLVERNPGGTIDLLKENRGLKYRVPVKETIELVTQSMDTGFIVSITPLEIIRE